MSPLSRRRFLVDLVFAGGILSAAAGLAWSQVGEIDKKKGSTPTPQPTQRSRPVPGDICPAPTSPTPSATPKSKRP